jgi:hypothetical protein
MMANPKEMSTTSFLDSISMNVHSIQTCVLGIPPILFHDEQNRLHDLAPTARAISSHSNLDLYTNMP